MAAMSLLTVAQSRRFPFSTNLRILRQMESGWRGSGLQRRLLERLRNSRLGKVRTSSSTSAHSPSRLSVRSSSVMWLSREGLIELHPENHSWMT